MSFKESWLAFIGKSIVLKDFGSLQKACNFLVITQEKKSLLVLSKADLMEVAKKHVQRTENIPWNGLLTIVSSDEVLYINGFAIKWFSC